MKELSKLRKQIIYSYLPRVLNLLIVPIQVSILTKNLSVSEYGVLTLLQSSFAILTFIFTLGIQKYLSVKIPGKNTNIQYAYFKSLLFLELLLYIIFGSILYLFINDLLQFLNIEQYKQSAVLFLAIYFFSLLYNELGRFLNYRKMIGTRVFLGVVEKVIELFTIIITINVLHKNDIYHIAMAYLILYVLMTILYSFFSINYSEFTKTKTRKIVVKYAIAFGIPLVISDISWRLMQNVDFYFLASMNMKEDLGIYSFIAKLLNYIYLAGSPIIWVVYPYLTAAFNQKKRMDKKVYFFIKRQYKYSFLFLTFSMGILLINLNFFVLLISKKEYLSLTNAYYLYAIYPILLTIMYIQQQILLLSGRTKYIGMVYFIGLSLNIVLDYLLISLFGIYGAIIATIVATVFIILMQNRYTISINMKILVFPFIILFIVFGVHFYVEDTFFANVIFIVIYMLFAYFLKILNIQEINMFKKKILKGK